ncbi:Ion channel CASTOR [Diplonema papillatum]|nr:Ion channel CASTOR [Diplonema papillatum]
MGDDDDGHKSGGAGMFVLGCIFSSIGALFFYLRQTSELKRVTRQNYLMAEQIRLMGSHPEASDRSNDALEEGLETWLFLVAISSLLVISGRFLLREYSLLRRTRDKITETIEAEQREHPDSPHAYTNYLARKRLVRHFVMYRLDYWFSASAYSKPLSLLFLTVFLIVLGGILMYFVKTETVGSAMWHAWAFIADSGVHAEEQETGARIVALMLTIGGMLVFALVIGLISDAISDRFDSLKQGKARVIETGHTLILGWSDKTLPLIREIANANESLVKEGKSCAIVVLAEMDKEVMEQEVRDSNINLRGSIVVCRKGNATVLHDLQHVSAKTARSVIVLSSVGMSADEADSRSLRVVLCLVGLQYQQGHITVEVADVDNSELVHIIGGDLVETVVAHDFIGRLIVQSSRQPGLAPILERVLGFEGCEFYMEEWPGLIGKKFSEVLFCFDEAIPLGVRLPDTHPDEPGSTRLNPPDNFVIEAGMQIIVLAEDDDSYHPCELPFVKYPPKTKKVTGQHKPPPKCEKVLFIGWRRDLADMLHELDSAVAQGSELTIFSTVPEEAREEKLNANGRDTHTNLLNLTLRHVTGNPVMRHQLEKLPVEEYDSIFILADEEYEADMEIADGRSLTSLLLIHDIRSQRRPSKDGGFRRRNWVAESTKSRAPKEDGSFAVVSEVLDPRTRSLINMARVSDYVMSNEMVSAALAMVAECRDVNSILKELLSNEGNEIYVRPCEDFIPLNKELSFWEVMSIVRCHNCVLMGYRSDDEPVLNPIDKARPRKWSKGDKLVVLAED